MLGTLTGLLGHPHARGDAGFMNVESGDSLNDDVHLDLRGLESAVSPLAGSVDC